jgi:hypothetical protein
MPPAGHSVSNNYRKDTVFGDPLKIRSIKSRLFSTVIADIWLLKIILIFSGLGWPTKIEWLLAAMTWPSKIKHLSVAVTFNGYFHKSWWKFQNRRKLFGLSFGGLCIAAKIITALFLVIFPSRRKLLCTMGFTHPHFNFTPALNWKIIHTHIIIYIYNHTQQS